MREGVLISQWTDWNVQRWAFLGLFSAHGPKRRLNRRLAQATSEWGSVAPWGAPGRACRGGGGSAAAIGQTLEGSFSAVSKPNFARTYAFESSRRDLHNALLCTALKSYFSFFPRDKSLRSLKNAEECVFARYRSCRYSRERALRN